MNKKALKNLMILSLTSGLIFSLSSCKDEVEDSALFIYLSGANLESEYHQASNFINELISSKANEHVTIYLLAGGSESWGIKEFNPSFTTFLEIKDGKMKKIEEKKMNMGDKNTLKYLTDFSNTIETKNKNLLFWGHGNKFELCHDHNFNYDALNFKEVYEGLGNSKFETIYFNSCFASNLDLLSYISKNANYCVASEQTFPSKGFDTDKFLKTLIDPKLNTLEKNKKIIDDTKEKYSKTSFASNLSLSCVDLNELNSNIYSFSSFFLNSKTNYLDTYKAFRNAFNIGSSSKDFLEILTSLDDETKSLLEDIIKYETHSELTRSNGIGIYFDDNLKPFELGKYSLSSFYPQYYSLLKYKTDNLNGNFITIEPTLKSQDKIYSKRITNKDFLGFISYAFYDESNTLIKEDVLGLDFEVSNSDYIANLDESSLIGYKFNDLVLNNTELYSLDFKGKDMIISYISPLKVNGSYCYLKFTNVVNESKSDLFIDGILTFDEETSEERIIPLALNDEITLNDVSFNYSNQNITTYSLNNVKLILIAEDIFGKQYFSNLELLS